MLGSSYSKFQICVMEKLFWPFSLFCNITRLVWKSVAHKYEYLNFKDLVLIYLAIDSLANSSSFLYSFSLYVFYCKNKKEQGRHSAVRIIGLTGPKDLLMFKVNLFLKELKAKKNPGWGQSCFIPMTQNISSSVVVQQRPSLAAPDKHQVPTTYTGASEPRFR